MLRTISEAASLAQPGDTVTVHAGTYRERVNPPRGGTGENARITYQAAPGETVIIKGSEAVTGWEHVGGDTWKVTLPNSTFGLFNPYNNLISGDWFDPMGRSHHTGAVYQNGHWLTEAANKTAVLQPAGGTPLWFAEVDGSGPLLNVSWLQPYAGATAGTRVDASWFDRDLGVTIAPCSEGGDCVGWIESGDWTRYDHVNFGENADSLQIRASSGGAGGVIEVRLDGPTGVLLGSATVPNTGGWQNWSTVTASITPTSGTRRVCLVYRSPVYTAGNTSIWAQFPGKNPNDELVEINVRQSVFYPEERGLNFITVRGFTMEQAATPWTPPTAEQVSLIGTHWSKGWIIENNTVRYSVCAGISLGNDGDRWDNTATTGASGVAAAEAYVQTVQRALANGWNKDHIGGHVVRGNHVSNCEQAGIVGSLGGAFSTITGNHIHDIYIRRLFSGAEMAGLKLHGAVDTQITGNHIHHTGRGIWLDWMAQGTRVSGCLFHDNDYSQDLFLEVNHGPTLIDHNAFLSSKSVWDFSQGEAYVHNLFAGTVVFDPVVSDRVTPYLAAHATAIAGNSKVDGGDNRFYNNIFVGPASLASYNSTVHPVAMEGNVFLKGATPSTRETNPLVLTAFDPNLQLRTGTVGSYLEMTTDPAWATVRSRSLATTGLLGNALVPGTAFEKPDGTALSLDTDYHGAPHNANHPFPGPFENAVAGGNTWKVSTASNSLPESTQVMERIHVDLNASAPLGTAEDFSGTPATVLGAAGETWNHVTPGVKTSGSASLRNSAGETSAATLAWTPNNATWDNSTPVEDFRDLLGDYAYLYTGGITTSTWTFRGLAPNGTYRLVIYAATGNAGGRWTVNGVTKEALPIPSAVSLVEGQNYLVFDNVRPNGNGELAIGFAIRSGQTYAEMAALQIETVSLSAASAVKVSAARFQHDAFEITATGLDLARRYVLARSADLRDGFPLVIGSAFSPAAETVVLTDPAPPPLRAFYRIEELP